MSAAPGKAAAEAEICTTPETPKSPYVRHATNQPLHWPPSQHRFFAAAAAAAATATLVPFPLVSDDGAAPSGSGARLGCPFAKKDPWRSPRKPSCLHTGFNSTARVKEHIYRCHMSIRCPRCCANFKSRNDLQTHQRSLHSCRLRSKVSSEDSIDGDQEKKLKSRKRSDKSETEKWKDIYKIIFPDDCDIPSPCGSAFEVAEAMVEALIESSDWEPVLPSATQRQTEFQELSEFWRQQSTVYLQTLTENTFTYDSLLEKLQEYLPSFGEKIIQAYLQQRCPVVDDSTSPTYAPQTSTELFHLSQSSQNRGKHKECSSPVGDDDGVAKKKRCISAIALEEPPISLQDNARERDEPTTQMNTALLNLGSHPMSQSFSTATNSSYSSSLVSQTLSIASASSKPLEATLLQSCQTPLKEAGGHGEFFFGVPSSAHGNAENIHVSAPTTVLATEKALHHIPDSIYDLGSTDFLVAARDGSAHRTHDAYSSSSPQFETADPSNFDFLFYNFS